MSVSECTFAVALLVPATRGCKHARNDHKNRSQLAAKFKLIVHEICTPKPGQVNKFVLITQLPQKAASGSSQWVGGRGWHNARDCSELARKLDGGEESYICALATFGIPCKGHIEGMLVEK